MKQKLRNFTVNGSLTRRATFDGKEYLVAPIVMIREGVLNGELVLASEFGTAYQSWNGTPVVINHPEERGVYISANSPEVLERSGVGQIFNVHFEDDALKGELWIDVNKATLLGGEALQALQMLEAGELLEVSTAYMATTTPTSGVYKGQSYRGVQGVPFNDHLALLPNQTGACSVEMGCGANRFNQKREEKRVSNKRKNFVSRLAAMFAPQREGVSEVITANEGESYNELWQALDSALSEVVSNPYDWYIVDVYDDAVIYRNYDEGGMFRRSYTITDTLDVTLGEPEEVVQRVSYETKGEESTTVANRAEELEGEPTGSEQSGDPEEPTEPEAETPPADSSESEEPGDGEPNSPEPESPTDPQQTANAAPCGCQGNKANSSQNGAKSVKDKTTPAQPKAKENADKPQTMDDYIAGIPDESVRSFISNGARKQAARRKDLIEGLTANARCTFTEDDMKAMSDDQLERFNEMLLPEDHSSRLPPRETKTNEQEPLVLNSTRPAGYEEAKPAEA